MQVWRYDALFLIHVSVEYTGLLLSSPPTTFKYLFKTRAMRRGHIKLFMNELFVSGLHVRVLAEYGDHEVGRGDLPKARCQVLRVLAKPAQAVH